jgi:NAD(P)-dependent dehydrogenase (short-subunit alcohol dehydrogenase family)
MSKTVLITGASTGIGYACTEWLADCGYQVLAGVRTQQDASRLLQLGDNVLPIILDVTSASSIATALDSVEQLSKSFTQFSLINNAGIVVGGPVECLPIEALTQQLAVNVVGPVALTQAFLPLIRQTQGRIVLMSSVAGLNSLPYVGAYCASKHALEALGDALRMELKPWNIPVILIEPGSIQTPLWEKSRQTVDTLAADLPEDVKTLYEPIYEKVKLATEVAERSGIPAEIVARVVWQALEAAKPKTRYLVGGDAKLRRFIRPLPDGLKDSLILGHMGL